MGDQTQLDRCEEQLRASEELSNQRRLENDRLREETTALRSALAERVQQMRDLERTHSETLTAQTTERIELHRLKREVEILKDENRLMKEDYERRLQDSEEGRKSTRARLTEAQKDLSNAESAKAVRETEVRAREQEIKHLTEQLGHAQHTRQQLQNELQRVEADRERELASYRNMVERYKSVQDEATREKQRALDLLSETQDNMKKMEKEFAEEKQRLLDELKAREADRAKQQSSLEISHAMVSTLAPAAAEEMLRNRGETLTKLYTELVDERERNRAQKEEIENLNTYMLKIVHEVEQTAPELIEARLNYNRVLANSEALSERAAALFDENGQLKESLARQSNELESLKVDNQRLLLQVEDLSSQVQVLLSQQSVPAGSPGLAFSSPPRQARLSRGSAGEDEAQDTISENLVQFKNIQELQQRNQQLLSALRSLAAESEGSIPVSEAMERLRQAEEEVKRMSEARQRQEEMIVAIVQQRDLYRSLLNQADAKHVQQQSQQLALPASGASSTSMTTTFQNDFEIFRKETQDQIAELNQTLDETRSALLETKLKLSHAISEREIESQRVQQFKNLADMSKAEAERVATVNKQLTEQVLNANALLEQRGLEVADVEGKLKRADYEKTSLMAEKKGLQEERDRLQQFSESLSKQRDAQRVIAEQFERATKDLQDQVEKSKTERDRLEKAATEAAADAKRAREEREANVARLAEERQALADQLEASTKKLQGARESLARVQGEAEALRRAESALKEQLERALNSGTTTGATSTAGVTTASTSNFGIFEDMRREIDHLKRDLEKKAKDVETVRAIMTENEKAMQMLRESNGKLNQDLESQARSFAEERSTLQAEMEKHVRDLEAARQALASVQRELHQAKIRASEIESLERRLKDAESDVKRFQQEVAAANENYSRELQLHASDVAAISDLRKELDQTRKQLDGARREAKELSERLEIQAGEMESTRSTWESTMKKRNEELDDYRRQNQLLLEEIKRLSASVTAGSSSVPGGEGTADEISRFREMLQIAQRSRDTAALEKEELALELKRAQSQLAQARTDVERLRQEVRTLEQQNTSSADRQKLQSVQQELVVVRNLNQSMLTELNQTKSDLDKAAAQLKHEQELALELHRAEAEAKSKVTSLEERLASKSHEAKLVKERLDGVMARIGNAELLDKLKEENAQLIKERDELKEAVKRHDIQVTQLRGQMQKRVQELSAELAEAQKQKDAASSVQARITALEETERTLRAQVEEKTAELEKTKQTAEAKDKLLGGFRTKLTERTNELEACKGKVQQAEEQLETFKTKLKQAEEQLEASRRKLQQTEEQLAATMAIGSVSGIGEAPSGETVAKREQEATRKKARPAREEAEPKLEPPQEQPPVKPRTTSTSEIPADQPPTTSDAQKTPEEPTRQVIKTSPPKQEQQPVQQEAPSSSTAADETPVKAETAVSATLDISEWSDQKLRRVSQLMKFPVASLGKEKLAENLANFIKNNGDAEVRRVLDNDSGQRQGGPSAKAAQQAQQGKKAPGGAPKTSKEELARRRQELEDRKKALTTLQPETLAPPPVEAAAPTSGAAAAPVAPASSSSASAAAAGTADEIARQKAARAQRFAMQGTDLAATRKRPAETTSAAEATEQAPFGAPAAKQMKESEEGEKKPEEHKESSSSEQQ